MEMHGYLSYASLIHLLQRKDLLGFKLEHDALLDKLVFCKVVPLPETPEENSTAGEDCSHCIREGHPQLRIIPAHKH
jgi:hypothetical protein